MKNKTWMVSLAMAALFHPLTQAQDQGLGDMMFTAGTVINTNGNEWAWLQWMATDSALLKDRPMDIYWKAGDETSAHSFALKGIARQVTDPRSIQLLLDRGRVLGEDLVRLEGAVDSLYAGADPTNSIPLSEKLAALIAGSQTDPELYKNLVFMGRAHPAVSMAIGQGFACKIPSIGFSTFEIRDHNTSEVIGRVILEAGHPLVLPAPGPIARVPETSPMGNLNIRLRWDIPSDLRRVSLLQFGYNLYRVTKYAATKWWGVGGVPPSTAELVEYVNHYEAAKKVNRMPILIDAATASPTTWYVVDDNDGQSPDGTPFVDGEEYYYYVTALDLLGRDGEVSDPFLTFPCDRFAPTVPHGIETRTISEYVGGVREQYVEISWDHDTNDVDTARYYVYRHAGISNMQANAAFATTNRISGAIVPSPTATRMTFEDHTLTTNDYGVTYWYTVRAEDNARCAPNLSGNSAPAYGLLRDWQGPPPATGVVVTIQVEQLSTVFKEFYAPTPNGRLNVGMKCRRNTVDGGIEWVEFRWYTGDYRGEGTETDAVSLGRLWYPQNEIELERVMYLDPTNEIITVFCRTGTASGKESNWDHARVEVHNAPKYSAEGALFISDLALVRLPVGGGNFGPHIWWRLFGGSIVAPKIEIPATPDAESVRVYRRIDGGRRTLIHQGKMDEVLGAMIEDYAGGAVNGSTICYYYQLFDENGNASPMVKIWCFTAAARADLPVPTLNPIKSSGAATNAPGMALQWFCTTPGVERFEVAVGVVDGTLPPTFGTQEYVLQDGAPNIKDMVVDGKTNSYKVGFYHTGRIGTTFGTTNSPKFTLNSPIDLNRDYAIQVRVIDTVGRRGAWSNAEKFRWNTVPDTGPQVPWPARPMPVVQQDRFNSGLGAYYLADATAWNPASDKAAVGIKIGEIPPKIDDGSGGTIDVSFTRTIDTSGGGDEKNKFMAYRFNDKFDLEAFLYTNETTTASATASVNQTLFPCVLYRYQLTNSLYQTVSGDVAQVSPLMEEMAVGFNGGVTTLYDAFIFITRPEDSTEPWGIFLLDTQPVVREATYQYLLVHFDEQTHEMDRIIPAGTVTIP